MAPSLASFQVFARVAATSFVDPVTGKYTIREPRRPRRGRAEASAFAGSSGNGADPRLSTLDRFELKADVDRGRRMRQRADGNEAGPGGRELRDAIERDAAGDFRQRSTLRAGHGLADVFEGQIVEQDRVGARREGLVNLREALGLDLDRQVRPPASLM